MGGISGNQGYSSSQSANDTRPVFGGQRQGRRMLGNIFEQALGQGGNALTQPMGILGGLYNNMFSQGGDDYLGARRALERSLSGEGLGQNVNTAFTQLLPVMNRNIQEGVGAIGAASGPLGNRFSTDRMMANSRLGRDIMGETQAQALGAGLQQGQMQAGLAGNFYNQMLQQGWQQSPLALAMQWFNTFAPSGGYGSSQSRSWNQGGSLSAM